MCFCKNAMWAKFKELFTCSVSIYFHLFLIHDLIINQALFYNIFSILSRIESILSF
jgi:hypothetical protein